MTTVSLTLNESAWQYACDKANAEAQKTHDAAQDSILRAAATASQGQDVPAREPFVHETWQAYAQRIVTACEASYLQRQTAEHIALISAQDPVSLARMAKVTQLPQTEKDALAAQVDAL